MRYWILGLIMLGLTGRGGDITNEEAEAVMPPGYKILCSVEGGIYTLWMPHELNENGRYEGRKSVNIWDSKEKVTTYAVNWEKGHGRPYVRESDKYKWDECPK